MSCAKDKNLMLTVGLAAGSVVADSAASSLYRYVATPAWAEANGYVPTAGARYDTPEAPALDIQAALGEDSGGLACDFRIPTAVDCDFVGNQATAGGGAISDASTFLYFTYHVLDCRFRDLERHRFRVRAARLPMRSRLCPVTARPGRTRSSTASWPTRSWRRRTRVPRFSRTAMFGRRPP